MASKKFFKTLGMATIVCAVANVARRKINWEMYVWEGKRADKAIKKLIEANNLDKDTFQYVSDSGTVPIYTYNAKAVTPEKMALPEGYILHKMIHPSGSTNYVLGKEAVKKVVTTYYPAYLYLEDSEEWEEEFDTEEDGLEEE